MIRKGDRVEILPEWQDEGDDKYIWEAISDEEKGRVDIKPINFGWRFPPTYVVNVSMVKLYSD